MDEKKVDITKYPEGAQYLAQQLKLPVPPDQMQQRMGMVVGLIGSLVRQ